MSALVTTVDGWHGTVRSIRWSPMLVTPVATCAALVVVRAVAGPGSGMGVVGKVGLASTAVAAAFVADDAALETAPATPVAARARLTARAVVAVPVVVLGWVLVLGVHHSVSPLPAAPDLVDRALAGLGVGSTGLALATLAGRLQAVVSPGAAGVGAMACLGVASMVLPAASLAALPAAEVVWPPTILLALVTVAVATREPLDRSSKSAISASRLPRNRSRRGAGRAPVTGPRDALRAPPGVRRSGRPKRRDTTTQLWDCPTLRQTRWSSS